jgi:hypothetical protein
MLIPGSIGWVLRLFQNQAGFQFSDVASDLPLNGDMF